MHAMYIMDFMLFLKKPMITLSDEGWQPSLKTPPPWGAIAGGLQFLIPKWSRHSQEKGCI